MLAQRPYYPDVPAQLTELFAAEGLTLIGVADSTPDDSATADYRRWIGAGYAGEMHYLARHAEMKYHPERLLPGCCSLLVAGINYYRRSAAPTGQPRVARYAWGRDYHRLMGKRLRRIARRLGELYPAERFRPFSDATPLAERHFAEQAGIGFTGRHTLLISGQFGSWFLLGEILSTRRFVPVHAPRGSHGACPSSCQKCIDICPTGALLAPYRINASRCISYLTIEYQGSIPVELRPKIGNWLFGCDLCQEVCPLNVRTALTREEDFLRDRAGESPDLAVILSIESLEQFRTRFAGSPLARARRQGLLRNACIVAANCRRFDLLGLLRKRAVDTNPIIAEHARWALDTLLAPAQTNS